MRTTPRFRSYRQDVRARKTAANADGIVRAAVVLVKRAPRVAAITLEDIASESGLTVRTILRRFGSRDGVLEAAFLELKSELKAARVPTPPGDLEAAMASLVGQYEQMGDFNIRALEEERQLPLLHRALNDGRHHHREWLREIFGPHLARLGGAERERRITALYAATDVYLWKLLRRDLHLDARETERTLLRLVRGVLALAHEPRKGDR